MLSEFAKWICVILAVICFSKPYTTAKHFKLFYSTHI